MRLETIRYDVTRGWLPAPLPALNSDQTLVVLFCAPGLFGRREVFQELQSAYSRAHIIGCSTAGEIDGMEVHDDSIVGAVVEFEHTSLRIASATIASAADSMEAAKNIARALQDEQLRAVFVLSDGIHVNGSQLVAGLRQVLTRDVVVTGGLAGDGDRFERTFTLSAGLPVTHEVSAVGLYGTRTQVGHGSAGGWDIFGPERLVTRARDNVLYELDGKPALELYKRYLGERASELPAAALLFPLALRLGADDGQQRLVRTILAVDEAENSMTFAGDIPVGSQVQLMRSNIDRLVDASAAAAEHARRVSDQQGPTLAIAISCVGRRLVLRGRTDEELEAALGELPAGTTQIGFYSYGEISPVQTGPCDLHNQTMTITTISEC